MRHLEAGAAVAAALALLLAAGGASAQRLSTGVKGGFNSSTVAGPDAADATAVQAFSGGAFLTLRARRTLAFRAELLYTRRGGAWSLTEKRNRVRLDYIEVPLLAKLSLPLEGAAAQPHLLAGPDLALRVRCRIEAPEQGIPGGTPCEDVDGATFTRYDVGVAMGGGFDFLFGHTRLTLDARYVRGLTRMVHDVARDRIRSRTFTAMMGVALPLLR